jgi:hypothetical protein
MGTGKVKGGSSHAAVSVVLCGSWNGILGFAFTCSIAARRWAHGYDFDPLGCRSDMPSHCGRFAVYRPKERILIEAISLKYTVNCV